MRTSSQSLSLPFALITEHVTQVQDALLAWYAIEQRPLPWRITDDPYAILVSEVMLQQTQVDRVLPKYAQFLAAFPTLADLAMIKHPNSARPWPITLCFPSRP
jgi:A/G-specific adenine glycosylase